MGKKYPLHDFSQMPTFTEIAKLKLCHEHAFELAEGEILELWQTPEGKLFFKKGAR